MQNLTLRAAASELPSPSPRAEPTAVPEPSPTSAPAAAPAWQSLYPELYAQSAQRSTVDEEKTVYLTFDDGPSARTPEILAILAKYNVKATFFVVGKSDEQSKQWMRDIVAAGHSLGMHSYTHDYKTIYASMENFLEDYDKIYQLIYEATGVYPQISRFPGGSINGYNGASYENMISELVRRGFVYFDWNVATGDAASNGSAAADTLVHNALDQMDSRRRAVVLMHDSADKKATVAALSAIIEGYQKADFAFAALTPEVVPVVYTYPK
ncbi:MAG: polysaccharide deacetylase [Clostridia bacterium]|nr:polysaccharide deacetylase [Clostridia bacterium]